MAEPKLYAPCSIAQREFIQSKAFFTIFGGAAGSGKSMLAQMFSLQYMNDPYFRAVYIRQNSVQHSQSGYDGPLQERSCK